jgi:hypothetical protein
MFRIGEAGELKGLGFLACSKGMLVMLLHNSKTSAGLVNGITVTVQRASLDIEVKCTYPLALYIAINTGVAT